MFSRFCLFLIELSLLRYSIVAQPSDPLGDSHADLVLSQPEGNVTIPSNNTSLNLTLPGNGYQTHCSGERYRRGLSGTSCADAVKQIPQLDEILRFQMRGFGDYDVPLPTRFISGRSSQSPALFLH